MITLIAVFCNRFRYTEQVVPSILSQKFSGLQIIFIDNGSTDQTYPYLKRTVEENPDTVTLIRHKTNIGKPIALDSAIRNAGTTYILAVDGDILLPSPTFIASLFDAFERLRYTYPNLALLSPRYNKTHPSAGTPDDHIHCTSKKVLSTGEIYHIAETVNVAGGCQLFLKHYYWDVGGFTLSDQYYGNDDVSFFKKLKKANLLSVYAEDIRVIHLGDQDVKYFPVWREIKAKAHTSAAQGKIYKDHSKLFI